VDDVADDRGPEVVVGEAGAPPGSAWSLRFALVPRPVTNGDCHEGMTPRRRQRARFQIV
jgi:hypothetical protein